jgi:saxitoxin biosynthesis operon SxtJ-like protein
VSGTDTSAVHDRLNADDEIVVASPQSFGLVFAAVFAIYGGIAPLLRHRPLRAWALVVSVLLLAIAAAAPRLLNPAAQLWQRVGLLLHHVVNPVVMAVLYYGAVTPCAVIMRTLGRGWNDRLDIDRGAESYWIRRDASSPLSSMTQQF